MIDNGPATGNREWSMLKSTMLSDQGAEDQRSKTLVLESSRAFLSQKRLSSQNVFDVFLNESNRLQDPVEARPSAGATCDMDEDVSPQTFIRGCDVRPQLQEYSPHTDLSFEFVTCCGPVPQAQLKLGDLVVSELTAELKIEFTSHCLSSC